MRVLVVGSGGREHALVWKFSQSPKVKALFCAPGNPGTAQYATNVDLKVTNVGALALWALENKIDLTVVGPEAPLAEGIVDVFESHGLKIFGPSKAAAKMESSKSFAKEIMIKAGVSTAVGKVFSDYAEAKAYVLEKGAPIVIKADGLAAGKGVVVAETEQEAVNALLEFMVEGSMGESGKRVVIEECIIGREASVIAVVDGETVLPLVVSQDYKRLSNANLGPNTGGMGAVSPTPVLSDSRLNDMVNEIFLPVVRVLWERGIRYRGFLYAGVIVDKTGVVRVLEFNCRLGDPETQVLMMRMDCDLIPIIEAAMDGGLAKAELKWKSQSAITVVAASRGYPGTLDDGKVITGLYPASSDSVVFQAGTTFGATTEEVVSQGGRVLNVTALGNSVKQAREVAYAGLSRIDFDGIQYRTDIGLEIK